MNTKKRKQPCSKHNSKHVSLHKENWRTHGDKLQLRDFGDPMVSVTKVSVIVDDKQLDQIIKQQDNIIKQQETTSTQVEEIAKLYEGLY
jgi:hypothetical protein